MHHAESAVFHYKLWRMDREFSSSRQAIHSEHMNFDNICSTTLTTAEKLNKLVVGHLTNEPNHDSLFGLQEII